MKADILNDLMADLEKYWAHKDGKESGHETLLEHTERTLHYFKYILQEKDINIMLDKFQKAVLGDLSRSGKEFWLEMIDAVPVFHDIGKINPRFQKDKMGNDIFEITEEINDIGSEHSLLSAFIYIAYFKDCIGKADLSRSDKKILRNIMIYHAYIISRHHSNLKNLDDFLDILKDSECDKEQKENFTKTEKLAEILAQNKLNNFKVQFSLDAEYLKNRVVYFKKYRDGLSNKKVVYFYVYEKMLYSLLVAGDYYAASEYMNGLKIKFFGSINNLEKWIDVYENTPVMQSVRKYQREKYPQDSKALERAENINELRSEIFCEAEANLLEKHQENLFYLEAPTGSGKSNTAINLCFKLMQSENNLKKIYYIYPFNTLVEQNTEILEKIFGKNSDIMSGIAVVNSLTPVKMNNEEKEEEYGSKKWQNALLDRQFLNYPMILSTHVSLFNTIFGSEKESVLGFYQLMNSIVVLDEIQSYKNDIWTEIICFLKCISELLNMKIIIMSATLPNLDTLAEEFLVDGEKPRDTVKLLPDREKYFSSAYFKDRVDISYELLDEKYAGGKSSGADDDSGTDENKFEFLKEHIRKNIADNNKILVEFIKKTTAYEFWQELNESGLGCDIEYISGDDNLIERARILTKIKNAENPVVLVSTQVIEAGVDIDMEAGYKNISKLDSEEQFMGRINRSCKKKGKAYFFKIDDCRQVYKGDFRINNKLTLENEAMKDILLQKNFGEYYGEVMRRIKNNLNEGIGTNSINAFFEDIKKLSFKDTEQRMKLIDEDIWSMQVYLSRKISDENGEIIDGSAIWNEYKELLKNQSLDYAEKRIRLCALHIKMNNFIYKIKYNSSLSYSERCGDLFYIEDGDRFFEKNKFNRNKIQGGVSDFVDFV